MKKTILFLVLVLLLSGGSAMAKTKVTWFGQAFIAVEAGDGKRVVVDPFDQSFLKYPLPKGLTADVLLVTHEHGDHNNVGLIGGNPFILRSEKGVGTFTKGGWLTVWGTATFHDEKQGKERGKNTVYTFLVDGIKFCHLGDLGHTLTSTQAKSIEKVDSVITFTFRTPEEVKKSQAVDVLFVPVGGFFTLDPSKVNQVIKALSPKIVVPMHFKTGYTPDLPIQGPEAFLKNEKNVKKLGVQTFEITKDSLPKDREVWVLEIK
jgi:L-ascorbate metabolism protein UlaG (beta-lactamase superfamily)